MKKMIAVAILILFISILFLLASCAQGEPPPVVNRKVLPGSTSGNIISYGLYGMDGEIEEERHFQIDSGNAFEKIFAFDNLIEYKRDYKLLIFANYKQLSFSVDNQEIGYCYDFTAEPYEQTQCTITLPHLADGFYALLFVVVKDPNNISLDEEYRKQTDMSHLTSMRYSLQIGSPPDISNELPLTKCVSINDRTLDGIFLNDEQNELRRLLTLECDENSMPELFIHIGNQSDALKEYVVFVLYDWQQMPIDSQMAIRLSLPEESLSTISFTPDSLGESGVHNMVAICVESPYQIATMTSRRADFSIRIGIKSNGAS